MWHALSVCKNAATVIHVCDSDDKTLSTKSTFSVINILRQCHGVDNSCPAQNCSSKFGVKLRKRTLLAIHRNHISIVHRFQDNTTYLQIRRWYDFLLVFHSIYECNMYHFWDMTRFCSTWSSHLNLTQSSQPDPVITTWPSHHDLTQSSQPDQVITTWLSHHDLTKSSRPDPVISTWPSHHNLTQSYQPDTVISTWPSHHHLTQSSPPDPVITTWPSNDQWLTMFMHECKTMQHLTTHAPHCWLREQFRPAHNK